MVKLKALRWAVALLLLVFMLVISATSHGQDSAAVKPVREVPGDETLSSNPAPSSKDPAINYTIGSEDVLDIDVFGLPELTKTIRVANDGSIVLALLGRVQAAGFTVEELRKELEVEYGKTYLQSPQVTVSVKEFHSHPVSVIGSVDKPGVYQLAGNQTLIDMLSLAGGVSKGGQAAGRSVFVTRKTGFGSIHFSEGMRLVSPDKVEINLSRLFYSRYEDLNIPIQAYDIITVNQPDIFYVMGGVKLAAGFPLSSKDQVTVLQAVAMAGGLAPTASKGIARLIRTKDDGSRTEIPIELGKIIKGKLPDVRIAANDILYINDSTTKAALKRSIDTIVSTTSGLLIYHGGL